MCIGWQRFAAQLGWPFDLIGTGHRGCNPINRNVALRAAQEYSAVLLLESSVQLSVLWRCSEIERNGMGHRKMTRELNRIVFLERPTNGVPHRFTLFFTF